ncbi:MAG TPA: ABC transporter permease [Solirubrobacteraceae bacterium]|jgi:ribose transport system permease protein
MSAVDSVSLMRATRRHRSVMLLAGSFITVIVIGIVGIEGFASSTDIKSILLISSFLGIAAIGETLVALVGGIDVSIPFIITSANITVVKLLSAHWSAPLAVVVVILAAAAVGALNGVISWGLRVHPLLITLGIGFALLGGMLMFYGNVSVLAPAWLTKLSSAGGTTFGIGIPPTVVIWLVLSLIVIVILRQTTFGRYIYASGDNPLAADRMYARRRAVWISLFAASGVTSAVAGILLLGFTGGADTTVGEPYLLTTIAAVVVGGTTLLGGRGGYARTFVGALLLGVLSTLLVGFGIDPNLQETVIGLILLVMVSLYARESHPRNNV